MTNMEESKKVITSEEYTHFINLLQGKVCLKILEKYNENMCKRDSYKMSAANVFASDIINVLTNDAVRFSNFINCKIKKYENVKLKGDFPKNKLNEEEFTDEKILGYAKNFILLYAIEYFLLQNKPEDLESYLRITRVPQSKKYASELKSIYKLI